MKQIFILKTIILSVVLATMLSGCAEYSIKLRSTTIPVSFSYHEAPAGVQARRFRIQRSLTWIAFDLANVQDFNFDEAIRQELPRAKHIYNLRIYSEEAAVDSIIRLIATGMQIWAFVTDRPLVSRRTVTIEGYYIE